MDGPAKVVGEQVRLDAEQDYRLRGRGGFANPIREPRLFVGGFFGGCDQAVEDQPADRKQAYRQGEGAAAAHSSSRRAGQVPALDGTPEKDRGPRVRG